MAVVARGWSALRVFLEMIKFEHSIFALPFAMIGMMWASQSKFGAPWPGWSTFGWILLAMVSCRSAAMAFNRIVDRDIDAKNPRTQIRALPAGLLKLGQAQLYFAISCGLFALAAAMLNPLSLLLSPVALFVTLFYSVTKRFTPLCHLVLGLSLSIAPAAAWIAVSGSLHPAILPLVGAVMLWTAGFDVIYALQDETFDREHGLRSLPETLGGARALGVSRAFHMAAFTLLIAAGLVAHAGPIWTIGAALAGCGLFYEQSLVKPNDLSRVNLAFFTLNGIISLGLFGFALVDVLVR